MKYLLNKSIEGRVGRLVIPHKDLLLRFGSELVFAIWKAKDVDVLIINTSMDTTLEANLASHVLKMINLFSTQRYAAFQAKTRSCLMA